MKRKLMELGAKLVMVVLYSRKTNLARFEFYSVG